MRAPVEHRNNTFIGEPTGQSLSSTGTRACGRYLTSSKSAPPRSRSDTSCYRASTVTSASERARGPRVLIACSGLGHVSRGYEVASRELARALRGAVRMTLVRGGGPWLGGTGMRLPCLQRFGRRARLLGLSGERAY